MKDPYSTTGAGLDKGHADFRDIESAAMLLVVQVAELAGQSGDATALRERVSLIADIYPSRRCRKGASSILEEVKVAGDESEVMDIVTSAEKGDL